MDFELQIPFLIFPRTVSDYKKNKKIKKKLYLKFFISNFVLLLQWNLQMNENILLASFMLKLPDSQWEIDFSHFWHHPLRNFAHTGIETSNIETFTLVKKATLTLSTMFQKTPLLNKDVKKISEEKRHN